MNYKLNTYYYDHPKLGKFWSWDLTRFGVIINKSAYLSKSNAERGAKRFAKQHGIKIGK